MMDISIENSAYMGTLLAPAAVTQRQIGSGEAEILPLSVAIPFGAARQLRSKLLAAMLGAAAACLMSSGAHAAPAAAPPTSPAQDQHAIIDGHRIQPRRGSPDADHLDRNDTQTVEELYRQLMTMGANDPASADR
jgi:hypothetical protein